MGRKDVIISVRVPEWLKVEMDRTNVNWSEYIRSKIEERIRLEKLGEILSAIEELKGGEVDS